MNTDFFEPTDSPKRGAKEIGHLHGKIFLLVFAFALLAQIWLWGHYTMQDYHRQLAQSFKIILTQDEQPEQLERIGQELLGQAEIARTSFFSPQEALAVVRHKNPRLADSLVLLGKNKMPPYLEVYFSPKALTRVQTYIDALSAQYPHVTIHYNDQHGQLLFYTALYQKLLYGLGLLAGLALIALMFLIEAAPSQTNSRWGGLGAGMLAGLMALVVMAGIMYPLGVFAQSVLYFKDWPEQALLLTCCALMGWTVAKWQKF